MTVMQWSLAQRAQFRYVVGMQMCVYRLYELEVESHACIEESWLLNPLGFR
jgi:hypothetical protein